MRLCHLPCGKAQPYRRGIIEFREAAPTLIGGIASQVLADAREGRAFPHGRRQSRGDSFGDVLAGETHPLPRGGIDFITRDDSLLRRHGGFRREQVNRLGDASRIWTIGHSTRGAEEFVEILREHQIEVLVDVRSFPGSRRYPHFNKGPLSETLPEAGIEYLHAPELGGRRKPRPGSKNIAWQNEGFRGYADYMETADFQNGIKALLELGGSKRAAIMCAEALWWRCHRSLIADYLKARGVEVIHIVSTGKAELHPYTSAARVINGRLSYEGLLA
jgi:uncharacterized protein DUF488